MEPITISAAIGGIVTFLSTQLAKNKSIKSFANDFIDAAILDIRPLFLKEDNTPQPVIQQLAEKPESTARQQQVQSMIAVQLEDQPELENALRELYKNIQATEEGTKISTIINSPNTQTGTVQGDNTQINISQ